MGQRLRALRLEKNLSQKQVAERIGVAVSAVSSYEAGTRYPSYKALIKLAGIYHVSCDYLIGLTTSRNIDVSGLNDEEIELVSQTVALLRKNHIKP